MTGGNANLRNVAVIRPVMLRDVLTGRLVPMVPVKRRIPHSQYYSRWQQGFSGSRRTDSTGARRLTSRKGEKQRLAKEGKEDDGSLGEGLAMAEEHANALYYGDNLEILRRYIKDAFPASSSHVKDATPSAASSTACCIACKAARSKRLYGGTASPPIYAADASRCLPRSSIMCWHIEKAQARERRETLITADVPARLRHRLWRRPRTRS